jgi:hypothetical protein
VRSLLLIVFFLQSFVLFANDVPDNFNKDKKIIIENINKWYSNLCLGNKEKVVSLYSTDITFFPTSAKSLITELNGVDDYFTKAKEKLKNYNIKNCLLISPEIRILNNLTAIVTGIDEVNGTDKNNDPFNIKGRQSFIFKKENSDWKIIHHHRSKMPE